MHFTILLGDGEKIQKILNLAKKLYNNVIMQKYLYHLMGKNIEE